MKIFSSFSAISIFLLLLSFDFSCCANNGKGRKHRNHRRNSYQTSKSNQCNHEIAQENESTNIQSEKTETLKNIPKEKSSVFQSENVNCNNSGGLLVSKGGLEKKSANDYSSILSNYLNSLKIFDDFECTQSKQNLALGIIKVLKKSFCQAFLYDIIIYGSFLFHASKKSSDIDLMAICPEGVDRKAFFDGLIDYFNDSNFDLSLRDVLGGIYPDRFYDYKFSYLNINTAKFPIVKLKFTISLKSGEETPFDQEFFFDLAMINLREYPSDPKNLVDFEKISLKQNFDNFGNLIGVEGLFNSLAVKKLFESDFVYQNSLKFLKLWAERKHINDFHLGYLKGIHLTIMLLYVRLENQLVTSEQDLLLRFAEYFKKHWHPKFVIPPFDKKNPRNLANYFDHTRTLHCPIIFNPVHNGSPMIDRMPYSVSQVILFEITELFNYLKNPLDVNGWEDLLNETIPYDKFGLPAFNIIWLEISIIDECLKSSQFISFIHSQLFKFIQNLEDLWPHDKGAKAANEEERIIIVVNHLPSDPSFYFKIFTPNGVKSDHFNEKNIIAVWNLFLLMIQSSFTNQFKDFGQSPIAMTNNLFEFSITF